jgi:hypothetical protein
MPIIIVSFLKAYARIQCKNLHALRTLLFLSIGKNLKADVVKNTIVCIKGVRTPYGRKKDHRPDFVLIVFTPPR